MLKNVSRPTVAITFCLAFALAFPAISVKDAMARTYTSNCTGEACKDLVFSFEKGCHWVRNTGSRAINVAMGPLSFRLAAGGSQKYAPLGSCPEYRGGHDRATYAK